LIVESGQQTQDLEGLRAGLRTMWGAVAPGWGQNADFVDSRAAQMSKAMLDAVALRPGDRVLELACGAGGLGLAAAELVGDQGEMVLSDGAPEMTAIAAARAERRGAGNIAVLDLDLESIDQPDDSYDAVLCREGIMLVPSPRAAACEIHRVLRPGGRAVVSVWGPRERNPWLGAMLDAVGAQLGGEFPPPGVPGPFSLDDEDELEAVLSDAGFDGIAVSEIEVPWVGASFDQWWLVTTALAGPLAKLLEAQPPEAIDAIRARASKALATYETADGLRIPGVALIGRVTAA
jgi:SAM-dependent methyltransferase